MKYRAGTPYDQLYHQSMKMICWPEVVLNLLNKKTVDTLMKYQPLLSEILAILGIALLFLGGSYFFLVQLARYGW